MKPNQNNRGQKPLYSRELADTILFRLCEGESLRAITKEEAMPHHSTVYKWIMDDEDDFSARYARTRVIQASFYADQILEESVNALGVATGAPGTGEAGARVMAKKLHIDSLKWMAGKLDSPKWGHKTTTELSGPDGGAIKTESAEVQLSDELRDELHKIHGITEKMEKPSGIE
jgi:hypothetical protein